jgi:16S rRNA (cytosine1402-N4)-methyltransferase
VNEPSEPPTGSTPEPASTPRRRRVRYRGTHPRHYEEKYKELAPDEHPDLIARVRERGMTPAGMHVPILVAEVVSVLRPRPGERGVDATLGYGGHAQRLLDAILPGGELLALDVDPLELPKTAARLDKLGYGEAVLHARRTNFAGLASALQALGWHDGVDFLFADLGLSSMQIDAPGRGFTFKHDGPLDMRMNPSRGLSAAQWLARVETDELARVLAEYADEPDAAEIAAALTARHGLLQTTRELADAVRGALPVRSSDEACGAAVRRVFQALRIAINDEFGVLDELLRQLPTSLRSGGRAALISFHSGEDRRVKKALERGLRDGLYAKIADEVVRPSAEERRSNPRSASAKLRWALRG